MKIFIYQLVFILTFLTHLSAQDEAIDKLMVRKYLTWEDIMLNSSDLITRYYNEAKYDSAEIIYHYWERKCGLTEPLQRFKILYEINKGTFSEDLYEETIWRDLFTYQNEIKSTEGPYASYNYFFHFSKRINEYVTEEFNDLTIKIALENVIKYEEGTLHYLLSKFYSGDFEYLIDEIRKDGKYQNSDLKRFYNDRLKDALQTTEGNLGIISGLWIPAGKNKILANHPEIGFLVGANIAKIDYNLTFIFRFLNTPEKYTTKYKGDLRQTNHFFGGYIGLDLGYELYRSMQHRTGLIGGFGYDGFDVIRSNDKDPDQGKTLHSFNMNVGMGYKYYFEEYSSEYLGFETRYNFVNYDNSVGTDLSGNTISLRLIYGWAGNEFKNQQLRELKYRY